MSEIDIKSVNVVGVMLFKSFFGLIILYSLRKCIKKKISSFITGENDLVYYGSTLPMIRS